MAVVGERPWSPLGWHRPEDGFELIDCSDFEVSIWPTTIQTYEMEPAGLMLTG